MRSYQLLYLLLFIVIYLFFSWGAYKSITRIVDGKRNHVRSIIYIYSLLFVAGFILIYIWPDHTNRNGNFSLALIFNLLLSADFILKIPLLLTFLLGLLFSRKSRVIVSLCGIIVAFGLTTNILYSGIFEKNHVVVRQVDLEFENLPQDFNGYKIMQISDIHLGSFMHSKKNLQKTTQLIQKYSPNALFFTGDLVNNYSEELKGWADIFKAMNNDVNSISILGNHDYGNYSQWESRLLKEENFEEIIEAHKRFGFHLLRNENNILKSGNDSIYILGVENWGHPPFPQYANLNEALKNVPDNAFKILLSHDPAHWESVVKYMDNIDLTLSGHTHGMQWGVKKAGITFSFMYFVINSWGGLYTYGKSKLYVNTGLGIIGMPWRINMPGEITLFTLKRIEVDRK